MATAEAIRSEATGCVRKLAMPIAPGESIKAQWRKVARKTGFTARRVRTIWYGHATVIHGYELDIIRSLIATEQRIEIAQEVTTDLRAEIADLASRLNRLIEIMGETHNGRP